MGSISFFIFNIMLNYQMHPYLHGGVIYTCFNIYIIDNTNFYRGESTYTNHTYKVKIFIILTLLIVTVFH